MSKFRYIAVKSYTAICPDGTVGATREAVEYSNISQADADARALSKAMIMANNATDCTAPTPPTPPPPPPPPPLGTVTLDAVAVSPTEIDLSWTAATGTGITYSVYRGATLLTSGVSGLSYPVTGLTQNTTYYGFYVVAINAYGSLNSNTAWATTPYAAPTAPVLTATDISSAEIDLTWPAVTGLAVTYSVYGYTSPDFSPSPSTLLSSGITDLFYHNTGLAPLTEYYYRVVAINPAGSATSNEANATTIGTAPSGSIVLTATDVSSSAITLTWTAATGIGITYNVYRGLTTGFTPSSGNLIASGLSGLTYPNTGLSAFTPYFYRVFAVNTWGGLESNEATATTPGNYLLWLKADAGIHHDSGSPPLVSQWDDQSGNGYNLTQSNPAFSPAYEAGILNSLPVVRWGATPSGGGTGDSMSNATFVHSCPLVVYLVVATAATDWSLGETIFSSPNSSSAPGLAGADYGYGTPHLTAYAVGNNFTPTTAFPTNKFNLITVTYSVSSIDVRLNGSDIGSQSGGTDVGFNHLVINPSFLSHCDIAEMIVSSDTASIAAVEAYLKAKYNL